MTDDTQQTHSEECWRWHHGCAERKVEALLVANRELNACLQMIVGGPMPVTPETLRVLADHLDGVPTRD